MLVEVVAWVDQVMSNRSRRVEQGAEKATMRKMQTSSPHGLLRGGSTFVDNSIGTIVLTAALRVAPPKLLLGNCVP